MLGVDLAVSSKVSLRLSPFSRLMPLKDESCDVVVICVMMLLYWPTRLARVACETGSATGVVAAANVALPAGAVRVTAPIVDEAASLVVVMTSWLVLFRLAVRLLLANEVFSWARDSVAPNVTVNAGIPVVAAIEIISPLLMATPSTRLAEVEPAGRAVDVVADLVV